MSTHWRDRDLREVPARPTSVRRRSEPGPLPLDTRVLGIGVALVALYFAVAVVRMVVGR